MVLVVDPGLGGRATSWQVDDVELLARYGDHPVEQGMYPMAPWAGRLRGNGVPTADGFRDLPITYDGWAMHGTVLAREGRVIRNDSTSTGAALDLSFDTHPEWPWPMRVDVGWRVEAERVTTTIAVNSDGGEFPAVVGWHPWFRRQLPVGGPATWHARVHARLERGSDALPTGRELAFDPADGPFDDALRVPDGRMELRWPGALSIDIASDAQWFVVYDRPQEALCLEPQTGPPDGLVARAGGSPRVVTPDAPLTMTVTWTVRREEALR